MFFVNPYCMSLTTSAIGTQLPVTQCHDSPSASVAIFCWRWTNKMQTGGQVNANTHPFSQRASGRAVMLRTEPAALSLPGPSGAAGFHPMTQHQRRLTASVPEASPCRAVACAPCTPAKTNGRRAVRGTAVSRAALRRCGGSLLCSAPGASPL